MHSLKNKCLFLFLVVIVFSNNPLAAQHALFSDEAFIFLSDGASINIEGDAYISGENVVDNHGEITITGNLNTDNQPFLANNSVIFIGNEAQYIQGNQTLHFENIEVNKPGEKLILLTDITVTNTLLLFEGIFDIEDYDLNLESTGEILGENNTNYITGQNGEIIAFKTLNQPVLEDIGNMSFTLTSPSVFGLTTIRRNHLPISLPNGESSIRTNYVLETMQQSTELNTITMGYRSDNLNLNDINVEDLAPFYFDGVDWIELEGSIDPVAQTITISNIADLKAITLGKKTVAVGINDITLDLVDLFPNPVGVESIIQLSNITHDVLLEIIDFKGNIVHKEVVQYFGSNILKINIPNVPEGTYILKVTNTIDPNINNRFKFIKL